MGRSDRELRISGLKESSDLSALTSIFARYGPCRNMFFLQGSTSTAIVCYDREEDVGNALDQTDGMNFEGRRLSVYRQSKKKGGGFGGPSTNGGFGASTSQPPRDPSLPVPLAPAPRLIAPLPSSSRLPSSSSSIPSISISGSTSQNDATDNSSANASGLVADSAASLKTGETPFDTWELSLYDSDYDDGFVPIKVDNKPKTVERAEWTEAYELMSSFARYGGAILAADVESWDQNHDYIIEVGLATTEWQRNNGTPPKARAMHLIIQEHETKRNGTYSQDAKYKFAFGNSKIMTETDVVIKLNYLMKKLSNTVGKKQPLILLFHNAAAEIAYFANMAIDISMYPTRIPGKMLGPGSGNVDRGEIIILDTQRLYKAFVKGKEGEAKQDKNGKVIEDQPMSLLRMAKKLGIDTKHLHNAGNDAYYTLQVLMKMAELENKERAARKAAYADDGEDGEMMDDW